jgi:hypothetical protein
VPSINADCTTINSLFLRYFVHMKSIKILILFLIFGTVVRAQDAVLISEGNFVRGIIQSATTNTVSIMADDQTISQYLAKDIQSYLRNGETFASKPIVVKKKMEYRFFKVIETGAVNLYVSGDDSSPEAPVKPKPKIRPTFGIGLGGGGGFGGGVSIGLGGGRKNQDQNGTQAAGKVVYYIEKPGSGPIQALNLENTNATRNLLLEKLTADEDLAQSIKATQEFDAKNLAAYIRSYNSHK